MQSGMCLVDRTHEPSSLNRMNIHVENEFSVGTTQAPYMQLIEDTFRANGLTKIPM